MSTATMLAISLVLLLAVSVLSEWHRAFRRRHLHNLSIDSLFDAVASGHMTSEEAVEEILRRHEEEMP